MGPQAHDAKPCRTCGTAHPQRPRAIAGWSWCPRDQIVHPGEGNDEECDLPPERHVVIYVFERVPKEDRR